MNDFGFSLFPLTFACGTLVFCLHVEWRRSWRALLIPAFILACGCVYEPLTAWFDGFGSVASLLLRVLYYICCSVTFVAILRCCTRLTWLESLVTVVAGYALQHLAVDVYALVHDTGWTQRNPDGLLERFVTDFSGVFIIVYALAYACIGRRRVIDDNKIRNRFVWVAVCTGILLFVITFSMLVVDGRPMETRLVGHIYDAICVALMLAVLMLAVLMLVAANDRLYGDLAALRQTEQLARHITRSRGRTSISSTSAVMTSANPSRGWQTTARAGRPGIFYARWRATSASTIRSSTPAANIWTCC